MRLQSWFGEFAREAELPFIVMFLVHELLGMTDAFLMGGDTPWDDVSRNYNLAMFAALINRRIAGRRDDCRHESWRMNHR